ncbi:hypothetical protein AOLI_G00234530 [Acnodon oligacanthus]
MRSLRTAPPLPLVFLLMTVGAFGTEWSVKYNQQEICALKGSTVFMNGTFTHPEGLTVNEAFWTIDPVKGVEPTDLSKEPVYSGRVEFFTDEQKHFSLKLSDVMEKDEHQFCFRIKTNVEKERWLGQPGVQLRVTELHVEAPEEVTEGETADLTCNTTCSLTDPTFIWYKNGRPLTTKAIENNQLHLQTVSSEDAGSYSCAVRGSQHLRSTAHSLRVRYPPKRVSVSISPSGEIVEGSSVTLTCSSDGNPPVKIYTWFKEGGTSPVGSGHTYSIINITADHTGLYYCVAQNDHGALNGTVMVTVQSSHVSLPGSSTSITAVAPEALTAHAPPLFPPPSVSLLQTASGLQPGTSVPQRRDHSSYADFLHSVSALPESQDDVLYSTVTHSTSRPAQAAASADSGAADVLYATVVQNDEVTSTDQQGEPQIASVTLHHHTAATGGTELCRFCSALGEGGNCCISIRESGGLELISRVIDVLNTQQLLSNEIINNELHSLGNVQLYIQHSLDGRL